jgi:hypothetical protein
VVLLPRFTLLPYVDHHVLMLILIFHFVCVSRVLDQSGEEDPNVPTEPVCEEEEFRFQSFAEKDHQEIARGIAEIESSTTAVDRIAAAV